MKKVFKLIGIIAIIAVISFSFLTCSGNSGDDGGDSIKGFTSIEAFKKWFEAQPDNTAETAYKVKLNVSGYSDINRILREGHKYISLDFSNSTFTEIRDRTFYYCTGLTSIIIPNGVTNIKNEAFYGCTSLASVTIPDSVTSIGAAAFPYCANLTSITIPNSVTSIGYLAFDSCTSLTSIRFERANTTIGITGVPIPTFINAANDTSLKSAYSSGGIGTYTRPNTSSTTWTKTSN